MNEKDLRFLRLVAAIVTYCLIGTSWVAGDIVNDIQPLLDSVQHLWPLPPPAIPLGFLQVSKEVPSLLIGQLVKAFLCFGR